MLVFTYSKEKELHEFIVKNFNRYFDFEYSSSEFIIKGGRVDIVGTNEDTIYILEIKRDCITSNAINQLSNYLPIIKELNPDKNVSGIAVAPAIDSKLNVQSIPSDIEIVLIEDVLFIEPQSTSTRKVVTFALDEQLVHQLKEVSEQTMIPQSRLVEQAVKEILEKHGK